MEIRTERKKIGWMVTAISLMVLTAALITAVAVGYGYNGRATEKIERTYKQNLYDLGDNLNNIEINLSKLMVAPEGNFAASLLTDVYSEAIAAEKALSSLPIDSRDSENAASFLNKVADFSVSYQRSILSGKPTRGYGDTLESMYVTARQLSAQVGDYVSRASQSDMDISKLVTDSPFTFRDTSEKMNHTAIEYPELIYDGPFSDAREKEHFRCCESEEKITLKEAKEAVRKGLSHLKIDKVLSVGKSGDEPLYQLRAVYDGGEAFVSVSERGGRIVNMANSRKIGSNLLGEENAKKCAVEFASKLGYDVQPVWYLSSGGVAYVNLAPIVDDVVLYTDLVKVKIALDNGEALGFEAKNYCLNHCDRDLTLTMNRAAVPTLIDGRFKLENVRGALIPLDFGGERLCYEAVCSYKGLDYFVYLDSKTGDTVKIMRTVDSEQGSMVM